MQCCHLCSSSSLGLCRCSSWVGEPEQMGLGGSSRQCREGEGRARPGSKEGCSREIEVEREGERLQARKGRMKPM